MSKVLPQRRSALHRKVLELVKRGFPQYAIAEEFPVKVRLDGRISTLYVDILIRNLDVAIECHGVQHFEFSSHLHGTREAFARSVERDEAKAESLKTAGFAVVVVRYDEEKTITLETLFKRITEAMKEKS